MLKQFDGSEPLEAKTQESDFPQTCSFGKKLESLSYSRNKVHIIN